jgi:hypothetical protein
MLDETYRKKFLFINLFRKIWQSEPISILAAAGYKPQQKSVLLQVRRKTEKNIETNFIPFSPQQIPTAVNLSFLDRSRYFFPFR